MGAWRNSPFHFILELPEGVNAAEPRLRIGLYEPVSGKQLPVTAVADRSTAVPGDTFILLPGDGRTQGLAIVKKQIADHPMTVESAWGSLRSSSPPAPHSAAKRGSNR